MENPELLRVCLECGEPTSATRCPDCTADLARRRDERRGGSTARGYTGAWQRRAAVVRRQEPACVECGSTSDLTVDHIVPKVLGGTDERSNLRTLCRRCNSVKGPRP